MTLNNEQKKEGYIYALLMLFGANETDVELEGIGIGFRGICELVGQYIYELTGSSVNAKGSLFYFPELEKLPPRITREGYSWHLSIEGNKQRIKFLTKIINSL